MPPQRRAADIAVELRALVENGQLRPGDRLPSENELIAKYGAARETVRAAVRRLVNAGLAHSVARSGTYVGPVPSADTVLHVPLSAEEAESARAAAAALGVGPEEWAADKLRQVLRADVDKM